MVLFALLDGTPVLATHEQNCVDSMETTMECIEIQAGSSTPKVIVEDTDEQGHKFRRKSGIKRRSAPATIRSQSDGEGSQEMETGTNVNINLFSKTNNV